MKGAQVERRVVDSEHWSPGSQSSFIPAVINALRIPSSEAPCVFSASLFSRLLIFLWILVCFQRLAMESAPNQATSPMSSHSIGDSHIGNVKP
jgi:hypothetical protein